MTESDPRQQTGGQLAIFRHFVNALPSEQFLGNKYGSWVPDETIETALMSQRQFIKRRHLKKACLGIDSLYPITVLDNGGSSAQVRIVLVDKGTRYELEHALTDYDAMTLADNKDMPYIDIPSRGYEVGWRRRDGYSPNGDWFDPYFVQLSDEIKGSPPSSPLRKIEELLLKQFDLKPIFFAIAD